MKKITSITLFLMLLLCSINPINAQSTKPDEALTAFFQKTLIKNFGKADDQAVQWLIAGIRIYSFNYILDIDREEFAKLNSQLYDVLKSYYFDYDKMENKRIMPEDWTQPALFRPYAPMSATEFKTGDSTYWKDEIESSKNEVIKKIDEVTKNIGGFAFTAVIAILADALDNDVKLMDDKETLKFLSLCFCEYLYYCGNIDFVTGIDKTQTVINSSK